MISCGEHFVYSGFLHLQVTLLKQNIGSIHRPTGREGSAGRGRTNRRKPNTSQPQESLSNEGDGEGAGGGGKKESLASSPSSSDTDDLGLEWNNVLDPAFLQAHNAEILCGPVPVANCMDLSGLGGLITLSRLVYLNDYLSAWFDMFL